MSTRCSSIVFHQFFGIWRRPYRFFKSLVSSGTTLLSNSSYPGAILTYVSSVTPAFRKRVLQAANTPDCTPPLFPAPCGCSQACRRGQACCRYHCQVIARILVLHTMRPLCKLSLDLAGPSTADNLVSRRDRCHRQEGVHVAHFQASHFLLRCRVPLRLSRQSHCFFKTV